jgi:tetratricopeptide (TPR) repeat protein
MSLRFMPTSSLLESRARRGAAVQRLLLLLTLIFLLLSPLHSRAEDPTPAFDAANKLYEGGKFAEAAAAYQKLAQTSPGSAAVYFNLGNAFFKSGQIGRAIVAYHQAEKIAPRDPDIRANLQFARNQIQGPTLVPGRWQRWLGKLTLNEWTMLASGVFWLWLLLLAGLQWRPALRPALRGSIVTLAVAAVLLCACLAAAWSENRPQHTAVVISQDASVHNGPFDESPTAFRLNDGAELRILDEKDNWLQVTADGRRIGWLRRDKVQLTTDTPF